MPTPPAFDHPLYGLAVLAVALATAGASIMRDTARTILNHRKEPRT